MGYQCIIALVQFFFCKVMKLTINDSRLQMDHHIQYVLAMASSGSLAHHVLVSLILSIPFACKV